MMERGNFHTQAYVRLIVSNCLHRTPPSERISPRRNLQRSRVSILNTPPQNIELSVGDAAAIRGSL